MSVASNISTDLTKLFSDRDDIPFNFEYTKTDFSDLDKNRNRRKKATSKTFSGIPSSRKKQDSPIEHDLAVSLKEVLNGSVRRLKVTRKVLEADGKTTRNEDKILTVKIEPGWKAGTRVTFEKEGSQNPGRIPADIVFVICDKPDKQFKRCSSPAEDVEVFLKISLKEVSGSINHVCDSPPRHRILALLTLQPIVLMFR